MGKYQEDEKPKLILGGESFLQAFGVKPEDIYYPKKGERLSRKREITKCFIRNYETGEYEEVEVNE